MKKILILLVILLPAICLAKSEEYKLTSPDQQTLVVVSTDGQMRWSASYQGKQIIRPSHIALKVKEVKGSFGVNSQVSRAIYRSVDQMLTAIVPTKSRQVRDHFNELKLVCKGGWSIVFRAYDNGVAYRFETALKKSVIFVESETAEFDFADDGTAYWPNEKNPDFITHCEAFFQPLKLSEIEQSQYAYLPVSLSTEGGVRMVVNETDLLDYPNLFLFGGQGSKLIAKFPAVNLETRLRGDRDEDVLRKADYIARTKGDRTFPWRILTIGDDRSLLENNLAWQLSSPEIEGDKGWIRPGKISWEWWCALNVYGVDFVSGVNTQTYKYYIDFAARYGLEYILLDEGWSVSTLNIKEPRTELDLQELIRYGNQKGVGVILWTLWNPMKQDMKGILDQYHKWGVKGIKIDFMQRCDQDMVNFYEQIAQECFDRKLLVDFHGSFKPAGLQRKYPNVMTFEGVYGMEHNKCSKDISPEHDLILPFTRMVAGPMDYTPGATINATPDDFAIRWEHPMSQGTRAHQAALYIVFESPLQMLCDSPSNYYREPEFISFIAGVPTVWDQTCAIEAKAGDYLLIARRSGDKWYVAGLNDWTGRELSLKLDFLGEGEYTMTVFKDGVNANVWASDFKLDSQAVSSGDVIPVKMANGGGWAAVISPKNSVK